MDELQAYVDSTEVEHINFTSLPQSTKDAYERYCEKSNHHLPGIEIGSLLAAMVGKANGLDEMGEDRLMEISKIVTVALGVQKVADIARIPLRKEAPTETLAYYLREWIRKEKARPSL